MGRRRRGGLNPGGGFSPRAFPGLVLWLDASYITGLNDGNSINTELLDLSGNGYHATQSTAAQRPIYKVSIINGRPVVRFDGTDDYLATAAFASALVQPTSIFIIGSMANAEGDTAYFYDGIAVGSRNGFLSDIEQAPDGPYLFAGLDFKPTATLPKNEFIILSVLFNGASTEVYKNGASWGTGNPGTNSLSGLQLGISVAFTSPGQDDIAALLIYNPGLTASNRQRVERYWGNRYGITVS